MEQGVEIRERVNIVSQDLVIEPLLRGMDDTLRFPWWSAGAA